MKSKYGSAVRVHQSEVRKKSPQKQLELCLIGILLAFKYFQLLVFFEELNQKSSFSSSGFVHGKENIYFHVTTWMVPMINRQGKHELQTRSILRIRRLA